MLADLVSGEAFQHDLHMATFLLWNHIGLGIEKRAFWFIFEGWIAHIHFTLVVFPNLNDFPKSLSAISLHGMGAVDH